MLWFECKNNFQIYAIFSSLDIIYFLLKVLRKLTKLSPCMTKLLNFPPIQLATISKYVSEDSKEMKKIVEKLTIF